MAGCSLAIRNNNKEFRVSLIFSRNVRVFLFLEEKLILRDYFDCAKYWVG